MNDQKSNPVAIPAVNCIDPIVSAKELTPLIRAHADETERGKGESGEHHLEAGERRGQLKVRGDDSGRDQGDGE